MSREFTLIARYFRPLAGDPAAGNLADDAAVLTPPPGRQLVVTKDMIAAGVHFLPDDPPASVGAKLMAVNLSDLAAMGATPLACLLGLGLARHTPDAWVADFAAGLGAAADVAGCALIGGDTIAGLDRPVLSLTAFGHVAPGSALTRGGARPGDTLWVSGTLGDAGRGLALLRTGAPAPAADTATDTASTTGTATVQALVARYRTPTPRLALGEALVGLASAAADVSDGALADAAHIAAASGLGLTIDLPALPLSAALIAEAGGAVDDAARLAAATSGDDYELLFTAPADRTDAVMRVSQRLGLRLTAIGRCHAGQGVTVRGADGAALAIPRLGYEHGTDDGQEHRQDR